MSENSTDMVGCKPLLNSDIISTIMYVCSIIDGVLDSVVLMIS